MPECDSAYRGASYSMQQQELTCTVHVALSPGFPEAMPHITLTVRSECHRVLQFHYIVIFWWTTGKELRI